MCLSVISYSTVHLTSIYYTGGVYTSFTLFFSHWEIFFWDLLIHFKFHFIQMLWFFLGGEIRQVPHCWLSYFFFFFLFLLIFLFSITQVALNSNVMSYSAYILVPNFLRFISWLMPYLYKHDCFILSLSFNVNWHQRLVYNLYLKNQSPFCLILNFNRAL